MSQRIHKNERRTASTIASRVRRICETLQSQRLGGTLDPVSDRTMDWILCRDCCGEILLDVKPVYVPFVDPFKFGPDGN